MVDPLETPLVDSVIWDIEMKKDSTKFLTMGLASTIAEG